MVGKLRLLAPTYKDSKPAWECLCACGNLHVVKDADLRNTKSCGCLRVEKGKQNKTHGMLGTPEYEAWHAMKQRCLNPNGRAYKNYGARGITVCKRWLKFENFYADMGVRPQGASLERTNNSKGYSPHNCVWASNKQQANNRRSTTRFVINGEALTLTQLSEKTSLSVQTLSWRIYKMGMSPAQAGSTPLLRKRKGA